MSHDYLWLLYMMSGDESNHRSLAYGQRLRI
jgi:hypothetical protein